MSKQADRLLSNLLEGREDDSIDYEKAVWEVEEICGVQRNTAETYIRRSDEVKKVINEFGDTELVDPFDSQDAVELDDDEVLEMEVGDATSKKFSELEKLEDVGHPHVPDSDNYIRRKCIGKQTDVTVVTSAMADDDFGTLLVGEAGVGKDKCVEHICAKTNRAMLRVTASGDEDFVDLLIGHYAPAGNGDGGFEYKHGLLPIAMRNGYTLVIDEINMLSGKVQSQLNGVLEDSDKRHLTIPETNETIKPHKEFNIVGTMNPQKIGYGGTEKLNKAFESRFIEIPFPGLDESAEKRVVAQATQWDSTDENLDRLLKESGGIVSGIRVMYEAGQLSTWVSTRDVMKIAKMTEKLGKTKTATELVLTGIADPNDEDTIRSAIEDQNWRQ
ncbi:MAG: AAA family ATPase [Halobacteria archaeon]